ncbi:hypothetical protein HZH66_014640 [Vespula vulgaris]|uniref:Histone-lysine N-methyltransferase SETMAR-like n=1 Tax=Vespula vulgaris TaxID=7454 RepID=A0A834MPR6_VESVU|nr:hypothetical protein HZH66_014640 [Vespula vulgaris]
MSKFRKLSDKLRCADLKLQPDKCNVRKKVAYLGHVISTTEIKSDPRKIRAVEDFPRPKPTKNVKQFLGLASYYRVSSHEIAEELNVSHTCIQKKLKQLGYIKKLNLWVPHQLKEIHLTQRISICDSLLKRNEIVPFLKRLITGEEKWIVYNNVNRRRSWVMQGEPTQMIPKTEIHQKKIMLSV